MNVRIQWFPRMLATAALVAMAGLAAPPARAALPVSQTPLPVGSAQIAPPLNMLVLGKDHKNYYEAYNDASDLNGDGVIDVGYKPDSIEYYGYFNSKVCYTWSNGNNRFEPSSAAGGSNGKKCSGAWSGDFLNYVTTGRLDALRKVLYGGWRQVDTATETVLQGAYFPQDGHSWGKEYQSVARDGYNITEYTPLALPSTGKYHLFAVTTTTTATPISAPRLRILRNSSFRVWNWLSIEGPVGGLKCFNDSNTRVDCVGTSGSWGVVPAAMFSGLTETFWKRTNGGANPGDTTGMNTLFANNAVTANLCGSRSATRISKGNGNPFNGVNGCTNDNFLSLVQGTLTVPDSGDYTFGIDGDDAIDVWIDGTQVVGWYGGHGASGNPAGHSVEVYLTAGDHSIVLRHEEGGGDDSYGLYLYDEIGATGRDDYYARVLVCPSNAALREDNCKVYGNGTSVKPTGVLHTFGEVATGQTDPRMYFGLLTGSQFNNLRGGVLRRNLSNFSDEINPVTGQFKTDVDGIARTLDRFRMIGGGYADSVVNNSENDKNWAWGNGTGNCPSVGDRAITNGECRMWGNPVGEMMLETLSYFAGGKATANYTGSGAGAGVTEENTLGLTTEAWKDPYKSPDERDDGLGFLACAQPVMTVISDINPSYDSDVPGNPWNGTGLPTLPATLENFSLETEGQRIWNAEFGAGSRDVNIGELSAGYTDGAPTVKSASSFGTIRGLSPEEPTKAGSYSSSAAASFGWRVDGGINRLSEKKVRTYAVALASPLPRIEFPIGDSVITFVPFAKTAGGTFGGGPRYPTNTIVDFYVQKLVNLPGQPTDATVNGGRGYAAFRINYEDVEQGNDHDMDAIVLYEFTENTDGTVTVKLTSEYAAGSAIQHMGYIASGTTADGVYLTVRDYDTTKANSPAYRFNVPDGKPVGYCDVATMPTDCAGLELTSTRIFTPNTSASEVTTLHDPLWYAAKYGGFTDIDGNGLPNLTEEWDANGDGNPDNYFLVTNALSLKQELERAFGKIEADLRASGGVAASGARTTVDFLAYVPEYNTTDNAWTGDLKAFRLNDNGSLRQPAVWSAAAKLEAIDVSDREVYYIGSGGAECSDNLCPFTEAGFGGAAEATVKLGLSDLLGKDVDDAIDYLRGGHDLEVDNGGPFRNRVHVVDTGARSRIGDIFSSQPVVLDKSSYGYLNLPEDFGGGDDYADFVASKETRTPVAFVGSNNGFIHAFDASITGGDELFAIAPASVLANMGSLLSPGYSHKFFVDGAPTQGDAYLNGAWKTVVLISTGAGGRSVVALDATNPATIGPKVLWEFTDEDLGLTIGQPKIAILNDGTWVAIFGNGYNSDNNQAFLFVVDLEDGHLLAKIQAGDEGTEDVPNALATPAIIDLNFNGVTDLVYAGDYYGNLWKFDLSHADITSNWDSAVPLKLFTATGSGNTGRQPITGAVTAGIHPVRGQLVFFGTGRYLLEGDNAAPTAIDQIQSFYGIWDDPAATTYPINRTSLLRQETDGVTASTRSISNNTTNWASHRGWYLDLKMNNENTPLLGERFIGQPTVALGRVVFTTYVTQHSDECQPGGGNWIFVLCMTNGGGNCGGSTELNQSVNPITGTVTIVTSRQGGDEGTQPDIGGGGGGDDDDDDDPPPPTPPPPAPVGMAPPAACIVNVDLLTAVGLQPLLRLHCGRQSWRMIESE